MTFTEQERITNAQHPWLEAIRCKLAAEEAHDLTDATIERIMSPCVRGQRLVAITKQYRDQGLLK